MMHEDNRRIAQADEDGEDEEDMYYDEDNLPDENDQIETIRRMHASQVTA